MYEKLYYIFELALLIPPFLVGVGVLIYIVFSFIAFWIEEHCRLNDTL